MIALFAGWLALLIVPILTGRDPTLPATAFLVGIPMVFLIGVLYALVSGLTTVFVVPLMIQADSGVLAAWRRLWGSIKTAWKQYLAYVVIAFPVDGRRPESSPRSWSGSSQSCFSSPFSSSPRSRT